MTSNDITLIIGSAITALLALWNAVSSYLDRSERRKFAENVELAKQAEAAKLADREEAEKVHRRRMEELALVNVRQGDLAAKKAMEAATIAATTKKELGAAIENSVSLRKVEAATILDGINTVVSKVDENTQVNADQIVSSNNFNGKLEKATAQIQSILDNQKPAEPPTS